MHFRSSTRGLFGLALILASSLLATACGGGGGGAGGGSAGGSPASGWDQAYGSIPSDFRTLEDFRRNGRVQDLLGEGRLSIPYGSSPPNLDGIYDYTGRIEASEYFPTTVGQSFSGTFEFRNHIGGSIDFVYDSPTTGTLVIPSAFIAGSGSTFVVCWTYEATQDVNGTPCTETDVGVMNGTLRSNGTLDLRIGSTVTGLAGACVGMLQERGYDLESLLNLTHVSVLTAMPKGQQMSLKATADTMLRSDYPSSSHGSLTLMGADPGDIACMKFNLGSLPFGAQIESATLRLTGLPPRDSFYADVTVWRVATTWTESSTWNSVSLDASSLTTKSVWIARSGYAEFDVSGVAKDWLAGRHANRGLFLTSDTWGTTFKSRETGDGPMLIVTYR